MWLVSLAAPVRAYLIIARNPPGPGGLYIGDGKFHLTDLCFETYLSMGFPIWFLDNVTAGLLIVSLISIDSGDWGL